LSDGRVVTVKRPSTSSTLELAAAGRRRSTLWQQDEDAFENEVEILTNVFSRRLVNLLGYNQDAAGKVKLLVVEFMENASLHSQLHTKSSSDAAADYHFVKLAPSCSSRSSDGESSPCSSLFFSSNCAPQHTRNERVHRSKLECKTRGVRICPPCLARHRRRFTSCSSSCSSESAKNPFVFHP
jgi:hypothetical protein